MLVFNSGSPGRFDFGPTAICWSNGLGLMVNTQFDLISGLFSAAMAPKGLFGPNSFSFVAPLWAEFYFGRNIGMWCVHSVAMERPIGLTLYTYTAKRSSSEVKGCPVYLVPPDKFIFQKNSK